MVRRLVFMVWCVIVVTNSYAVDINTIFNDEQIAFIKSATDMVQASLGYDDFIEVVYVTFWSSQPVDKKKVAAFNAYIAQQYRVQPDAILYVYERLLRSLYMVEYMSIDAREKRQWKQYYYYTENLLPDTKRFLDLFKNAIVAVDSLYAAQADMKEKAIKIFAIDLVKYNQNLYGGGF